MRWPGRGVEADQNCRKHQSEPGLPGQRSRCYCALASAGGVPLYHVRGTRCEAGRPLCKGFQGGAPFLPGPGHHFARSDLRVARFIIDMAATMAAPDVKDGSGFLDANAFCEAVGTERSEVGLSAMRTLKRFHTSSLYSRAAEPTFPSSCESATQA